MLFQDKNGKIYSAEEVTEMSILEIEDLEIHQFDDWLDY